jgi:signal peptidase I
MKQRKIKGIVILIGFVLLAVTFRWTFVTAIVQGESMTPTLQHLDTGLTDRVWYKVFGLRRFSLVVFTHPSLEDEDVEETWIKRIIGLPGETVYYHDATLYINGLVVEEPFLSASTKQATCNLGWIQENEGGHVGIPPVCMAPVTLGEHEYFVMGDHRENSYDSRYLSAPILESQIYARGLIQYGRCEDTPNDFCSEFQWTFPRFIGW